MTIENIIFQLNSGKSIDDLASEFAELLNQAQAKMNEETAEKKKEADLDEIAEEIIAAIVDYISLYNTEFINNLSEDDLADLMDVKHMRELLDTTIDLLDSLQKMGFKASDDPDSSKSNASEPSHLADAPFGDKKQPGKKNASDKDSERIMKFLGSLGL